MATMKIYGTPFLLHCLLLYSTEFMAFHTHPPICHTFFSPCSDPDLVPPCMEFHSPPPICHTLLFFLPRPRFDPSLQSISYLAPICHTYLFSQPDPDWIPWLYGILNLPTNCHRQATSVGPNLTKGVFQGEERSKVDQLSNHPWRLPTTMPITCTKAKEAIDHVLNVVFQVPKD